MNKTKKIIFATMFILSLTFVVGLISDWKFSGMANIFGTDGSLSEENKPHVKPPKKPDLLIENVFYNPKEPKVGQAIDVVAKIKNIGEQEVDEFKVKLIDQNSWGAVTKSNIQGDLYKYIKFSLNPLEVHAGEHTFKVVVDSNNMIEEDNEENNSYEFKLNVEK